MTMKQTIRILLCVALVLFGTSAFPFEDGFEAHALEPADIKAISIDKALPVAVKDVAVDGNGLLTATTDKPPIPPPDPTSALPPGYRYMKGKIWKWEDVFYGARMWCGPSFLSPVGSRTAALPKPYVSGDPIAPNVITVKFIAPPFFVDIGTNQSQSIPSANYSAMPANYWMLSVTRRPGDIALAAGSCGSVGSNPNVRIGPNAAGGCKFTPGETLYLNTTSPDIADRLNPAKNGCQKDNPSGGTKCDRNFKIQTFLPPASKNYCTDGVINP